MNLRLDFELLLKRHAIRVLAALVVCSALAVAAVYVLETSRGETVAVPVDNTYRLIGERYRAFRALLIPRQELETRQQAVIAAARAHGLQPGRIDYGVTQNPQGRFRAATLDLPVRGAYQDFRSFIAEVLIEHPALAIEALSVQRSAQGGQIEARLRLSLYATAEETSP